MNARFRRPWTRTPSCAGHKASDWRRILATYSLALAVQIVPDAGRAARAAQVTVITHGFQVAGGHAGLEWMKQMADDIAARMDPSSGGASVAQYNLQKVLGSRPTLTLGKGPAPGTGLLHTNRMHVIVLVDWRAVSGPLPSSNADELGAAMALVLLEAPSDGSFDRSLVELPLHFIGHSRGTYVNSGIVRKLGRRGIWVDHVTVLDAEDYVADGRVAAWDNIRFLDNYYQRVDPAHVLDGHSIAGAAEMDLTPYTGFKDRYLVEGIASIHARVHTWYHATIDLLSEQINGQSIPRRSWFGEGSSQPPTGYHFSRTVSGGRPPGGLKSAGASREASEELEVAGREVWDSVEFSLSTKRSRDGRMEFHFDGGFEDRNRDATIVVGWDADSNPYNGGAAELSTVRTRDLSGSRFHTSGELPSKSGLSVCYPFVQIGNGTRTRYAYGSAIRRPMAPTSLRILSSSDGD